MFRDALSYPLSGSDRLTTILVGGVLTLAGAVLVVPLVPLTGYLLRTVRGVLTDEPEPPTFDDWPRLIWEGIGTAAVVGAYLLVPLVLVGRALSVSLPGPTEIIGGAGPAVTIARTEAGVAGVVMLAGTVYLLPAAVGAYADRGAAAAFRLPTVLRVVRTSQYARRVLAAAAVATGLGFVAATLMVVVIGGFLWFVVAVAVAVMTARAYEAGRVAAGE